MSETEVYFSVNTLSYMKKKETVHSFNVPSYFIV